MVWYRRLLTLRRAPLAEDEYLVLPSRALGLGALAGPDFNPKSPKPTDNEQGRGSGGVSSVLAYLNGPRRRTAFAIIYAVSVALACFLVARHVVYQYTPSYHQYLAVRMGSPDPFGNASLVHEVGPEETRMWGMHEETGWDREAYMAEKGLEPLSRERYRLYHNDSEAGARAYFDDLQEFASTLNSPLSEQIFDSLVRHMPPALRNDPSALITSPPGDSEDDAKGQQYPGPTAMINYKNIFQTDVKAPNGRGTLGWYQDKWVKFNAADGWRLRFLDDEQAASWVDRHFRNSIVSETYGLLHRGVLKADMLRYLLVLLNGGVYTDMDTIPLRPIEHWGADTVEYLDISRTDGPDFLSTMSTHPAIIVGIEFHTPKHKGWTWNWPRPLQICQWTLASAPHHPIYLDTIKRIINATETVREQWTGVGDREDIVSVMEWTGPPVYTDAVLQYLQSRYRVSWHRLRGLSHPLRIGDVLVLPSAAFSPGMHNTATVRHEQAAVKHQFQGSWKLKSDDID